MTLPKPDHNDPEQNAFVQDWLSAWQKEIPTDSDDWDRIDSTIEAIQETYSPRRGEFDQRLKDLIVDEVILSHNDEGRITEVQVNGNTLDGKRTWQMLTISESCKLRDYHV